VPVGGGSGRHCTPLLHSALSESIPVEVAHYLERVIVGVARVVAKRFALEHANEEAVVEHFLTGDIGAGGFGMLLCTPGLAFKRAGKEAVVHQALTCRVDDVVDAFGPVPLCPDTTMRSILPNPFHLPFAQLTPP